MIDVVQERWDAKLLNWALWVVGGNARPVSVSSGFDREWWNHPPRPPQPLVGEAVDTDQLVGLLIPEHFAAVRAWYVWTSSVDESARELRIHPNTLRVRVIGARYRLDDLDSDRRRGAFRPPVSVEIRTCMVV